MKEIKATAPTPEEIMELVRENEKLKRQLRAALSIIELYEGRLENKTND